MKVDHRLYQITRGVLLFCCSYITEFLVGNHYPKYERMFRVDNLSILIFFRNLNVIVYFFSNLVQSNGAPLKNLP